MRALLLVSMAAFGLVSAASAADMPVKARAADPVPTVSWTGCHAGGVFGHQWGRAQQLYGGLVNGLPNAFLPVGEPMTDPYIVNGGQFGAEAGCNYQFGNWVIGFEVDGSWVHADPNGRRPPAQSAIAQGLNANFVFTTEQHGMVTARGRLGYARGPWLFYGTGGYVNGWFEVNNLNGTGVATAQRIATDVQKSGWVAGLGIEHQFAKNWSIKSEWLYADYGKIHYGDEPGILNGCPAGCANADVKMTAHMARLGVNYKFWPF